MKLNSTLLLLLLCFLNSCTDSNKVKEESVEDAKMVNRLPYFNSALFTPDWEEGVHKIPNFSFTNQMGEKVTNKTFEGKIYVADFFFTMCPGICPKLTKNMSTLQDAYKNDSNILLISHSVMPWFDTVEKLADYATTNGVSLPTWNLVTGDTNTIYDIARNGYFADEDFVKTQDASDFIHTENFILVDAKGYIRGVYNGTLSLEIKRLMRHIEILRKEL
ncbi:SCO family protein [uncultured Croceitalea sp.]|uniref:SCO family protein n=1 Tax=uncultured Croceitalea sp. TaxID=1798908 RepID=UPI00374FCB37